MTKFVILTEPNKNVTIDLKVNTFNTVKKFFSITGNKGKTHHLKAKIRK